MGGTHSKFALEMPWQSGGRSDRRVVAIFTSDKKIRLGPQVFGEAEQPSLLMFLINDQALAETIYSILAIRVAGFVALWLSLSAGRPSERRGFPKRTGLTFRFWHFSDSR